MSKTQRSLKNAMCRIGSDNHKVADFLWVMAFVPITFVMWWAIANAKAITIAIYSMFI